MESSAKPSFRRDHIRSVLFSLGHFAIEFNEGRKTPEEATAKYEAAIDFFENMIDAEVDFNINPDKDEDSE